MKIISFRAENVKRLKVVIIKPEGAVVEITGENDQGKSSTLDALWWLFSGGKNIQAVPIRDGEDEATIYADTGNMKVTRTFKRREDGTTSTALVIENADGSRYPKPQAMLDAMVGALSMDPLAFSRLKPDEKFDALRRFVKDFDFDEAAKANATDYDARTVANRRAKELRTQAQAVTVPDDVPSERVDEQAIVDRLADVGRIITEIEQRKYRREDVAREAQKRSDGAYACRNLADDCRQKITDLQIEIEGYEAKAASFESEWAEMKERLANADPLPEPPDTDAIRAELQQAKSINMDIEAAERRTALLTRAKEAEAEAHALTQSMDYRDQMKKEAIRKADLPVPGLGFGDRQVLLNGLPFEQASSSDQLRTSIAIAMASNPKLKVIRIQDGPLLDSKKFEIIRHMAEAHDFQVWIETLQSNREAAIIISDGVVLKKGKPDA